jgi:hypothetical protein
MVIVIIVIVWALSITQDKIHILEVGSIALFRWKVDRKNLH